MKAKLTNSIIVDEVHNHRQKKKKITSYDFN